MLLASLRESTCIVMWRTARSELREWPASLSWHAGHWESKECGRKMVARRPAYPMPMCCLSVAQVLSYIRLSPAARLSSVHVCDVRVRGGVCLPSSCTPMPPPPTGTPRSTPCPYSSRWKTITTMPRILKTKSRSSPCLRTAELVGHVSGKHWIFASVEWLTTVLSSLR